MQAYRISLKERGTFRPEAIESNLSLDTIAVPKIGPNQVLVRIHAAALNYRDLYVLTDDPRYLRTTEGLVPCSDGAGVVSESNNPNWSIGDRVITLVNHSWKDGNDAGDLDMSHALGCGDLNGTLAQYVAVDGDSLVRAPAGLSMEEASTLSIAYGTAWNSLFGGTTPLKPGHWVVTQGTGGVSMAALQLAVAASAKVIGTTSSSKKMQLLKELGASETINYRDTIEWSKRVQEITGSGADHTVDVVGASTIVQSLRAVRQGGLVSVIGNLSDAENHDLVPEIFMRAITVRGILYASVAQLREMVEFVEKNGIKPLIARSVAWTEAKDAYKLIATANLPGKIVVRVD